MFSCKKSFSLGFLFLFLCTVCAEGVTTHSIDKVIIEKYKRTLSLTSKGKVIKAYKIALGFDPQGHKTREGDGKTPEGVYKIDWRQHSKDFHKSLHISYPNAEDKRHAQKSGHSPGGAIMIHGLGKFNFLGKVHVEQDWTLGCVAVTNEEIDQIWDRVPNGTPIEILP